MYFNTASAQTTQENPITTAVPFLRLAADGQKIGDILHGKYTTIKKELNFGDITQIKNVPTGTKIFNIELQPNTGMKLAKAAGTFAIVIKHEKDKTFLKLTTR